jgi:hypothetical protein
MVLSLVPTILKGVAIGLLCKGFGGEFSIFFCSASFAVLLLTHFFISLRWCLLRGQL